MKCPYCSEQDTRVLETRDDNSIGVTKRRRECGQCRKRFTSMERPELLDLVVLKKNGTREPFNRAKVMSGVLNAVWKRGVPQERIERLVSEIEGELRKRENVEIPSMDVGNLIMEKLKELDNVAYIRFASVYRSFADVHDFEKELSKLLQTQTKRP